MTAKHSISMRRQSKTQHRLNVIQGRAVDGYERPRTRGDCLAGGSNEARPCPWLSCRHHLLLEVSRKGAVVLLHGHEEPEQLGVTCSLDVVDSMGAITLEQTAALLSITRERVRQIEMMAMASANRRAKLVLADWEGA